MRTYEVHKFIPRICGQSRAFLFNCALLLTRESAEANHGYRKDAQRYQSYVARLPLWELYCIQQSWPRREAPATYKRQKSAVLVYFYELFGERSYSSLTRWRGLLTLDTMVPFHQRVQQLQKPQNRAGWRAMSMREKIEFLPPGPNFLQAWKFWRIAGLNRQQRSMLCTELNSED